MTFLLVGADAHAPGPTTGTGTVAPTGGRADTITLVRLAADRPSASVVSIPRDSWVNVPGYGMNKINAAFRIRRADAADPHGRAGHRRAGRSLRVVDFAGFKEMTNALGRVDVQVRYGTTQWRWG